MPTINQLSSIDEVSAGDNFAVYVPNQGDARKVSMSVMMEYIQEAIEFPEADSFQVQQAAPSSTAFTIIINNNSQSTWLILTPTGTLTDGAITLPAVANVVDQQEVLVNCTQIVTNFVVNANGATAVTGEPSTLAANGFFRLKFHLDTATWYRVG